MSLVVLRAGLDTVEISFSGEIGEETANLLDQAKGFAQSKNAPYPVRLGVIEMEMQPTAFRLWRWHLKHPWFNITAKPRAQAGSVVLQVRLNPFGLSNQHPDMLWMVAKATVENLAPLSEIGVSRADVCADFHGWSPTIEDMKGMVCAAEKRSTVGTEAEIETFSYGKVTMLRVYNKGVQVREQHKEWWFGVWGTCQGYVKGESVWRVEFQTKRDTLKQLGISTMLDLLRLQGELLDYGLRWANLRVPTGDATKARWPEDERWTVLRTANFTGTPLQRPPKAASLMTLDRSISVLIGAVSTAGAYFECDDFINTLARLAFICEAHMNHEGIDFRAKVEEKRRRVLSGDM